MDHGITAIVPVFNTAPHHLIESVYSLINQLGCGQFPILIADDGSTSKETHGAIILLQELFETRIEVCSFVENQGTPAILNYAHEHVKTPFILLQGSQDISHPRRVKMQLDYIKANPKTDILGTGLFAFKDADITRKKWFEFVNKVVPELKDRPDNPYHLVNHGTVIYRKSVVDAVGGYNVAFKRGQDIELWKRLVAQKAVFRNLTNILYAWRR